MRCFKCGNKIELYSNTQIDCKEKGTCIGLEMKNNPTQWFSIIVAGVINSGKTYFIINLIRQLLEPATKAYFLKKGIRISLYGEESGKAFEELERKVEEHILLEGTLTNDKEVPFILKLECLKGKRRKLKFLSFFNMTGEFFESQEKMTQNIGPHIRYAKLFMILIDPTREEGMVEHLMVESDPYRINQNHGILQNIHKVVVNNPDISKDRRDTKVSAPAAICISKFDLFDLEEKIPEEISQDIFLSHEDLFEGHCELNHQAINNSAKGLEKFLNTMTLPGRKHFNLLTVKDLYKSPQIFAVAPIGHDDKTVESLMKEVEPKGLLAPFFWLLDRHGVFSNC